MHKPSVHQTLEPSHGIHLPQIEATTPIFPKSLMDIPLFSVTGVSFEIGGNNSVVEYLAGHGIPP
jgi:hypothetical protein